MSVLSGDVTQIPGAHNLAHIFVSATVRTKLREHDTDSGLGMKLGAQSLRRAGHAVLAGPGSSTYYIRDKRAVLNT